MTDKRPTKRFTPSTWMERLVPMLLVIILLALLATVIVVVLAVLGLTPGV
jgi:hypothetical protein